MTKEPSPERTRQDGELIEALKKPALFREFAHDPKEFAARYDVNIDNDIATLIKDKLEGVATLEQAQEVFANAGGSTVGIAIATGSVVRGPGIPTIAIAIA